MIVASLRRAVSLCLLVPMIGINQAASQAKPPPFSIDAEPFVQIDTKLELPLPIRIGSSVPLPKQAMVLIHGLTSAFSLTEGRLFDSGVWAVPPADIPRLKILAARQAAGSRTPLTISLVSLDGTVLARNALTLVVKQPADTPVTIVLSRPLGTETRSTVSEVKPSAPERILPPPPPGPSLSSRASAESTSQKTKLAVSANEEAQRLKSAEEALALDDVAGARLIFEYLARHGSAAGAYRLAQTYDPRFAKPSRAKADETLAATWYSKATELGHPDGLRDIIGQ